ncbi:MAG: ABC transporter ATP-binding protein [Cytophagaceae bacterium]
MDLLSISNIQKKYAANADNAVNGVNFSLAQGKTLAIVGENGSGKSTLLKIINGLIDPDSGEVLFNGEKVKGPSENLVPGHQQIKMLFQEYNLFPKHTIKENILYHLRYYNDGYREERVKELLRLTHLENLEHKLPRELSGGQQQRVALAKALADEPLLILMDEPFSNMDIILKDQIKKEIFAVIEEKKLTCIFVTHDLKDALSLSDFIAVMKDGEIIQLDSPKNIYEKPANEYVAYLFGQVNIVPVATLNKIVPINTSGKSKACIRPEHICICKEDKAHAIGVIKKVSYLGDSYELEVKFNNQLSLRINTRKRKLEKGMKIPVKFSVSKIHYLSN